MAKKAQKFYLQRLTVMVGSTGSVIDMMRYDNCVPDTEKDSFAVVGNGQRAITFRRYSVDGKAPTIRRWESFGCHVESWANVEF